VVGKEIPKKMNVYIDGIGYSDDKSTRVAMRVVKAAALMMGSNLAKFDTTPLQAAEFLEQYFGEVIKKHGSQGLESIDRVFRSLIQYEDQYLPQQSDDWPSSEQLKCLFEAFKKGGKLGLLKAIGENQKELK
jgi:hypothetical protein